MHECYSKAKEFVNAKLSIKKSDDLWKAEIETIANLCKAEHRWVSEIRAKEGPNGTRHQIQTHFSKKGNVYHNLDTGHIESKKYEDLKEVSTGVHKSLAAAKKFVMNNHKK